MSAALDVVAVAGLDGVVIAALQVDAVVVGASGNSGGETAVDDGPCFGVVVEKDEAGRLGGPLYLVLSIID